MLFFATKTVLEPSHFLIIVVVSLIIYLVWKSTNVRENVVEGRRLTFVRRSSSMQSTASNLTEESEATDLINPITSSVENMADSIINEATEFFNQSRDGYRDDSGPQEILNTMDSGISQSNLRHRNVSQNNNNNVASGSSHRTNTSSDSSRDDPAAMISIKLKNLNDDIKIVNANPSETIGDFKRRNFTVELETKLVKLVFNGKVLADTAKMSDSGIFDNAVMHVLIDSRSSTTTTSSRSENNNNTNNSSSSRVDNIRLIANSRSRLSSPTGRIIMYSTVGIVISMIICWLTLQFEPLLSCGAIIRLSFLATMCIVMIRLFVLLAPLLNNR